MKRVMFFIFFLLGIIACSNETKVKADESSSELKPNYVMGQEGYFRKGSSKLQGYEKELGVIDSESGNRNIAIEMLDQKIKLFLETNKGNMDNEKRSALDRAIRKMLFDYNLLDNTDRSEEKDFYVIEFLKNVGYDPLALFGVLKYVRANQLLGKDDASKIAYALEAISESYIETGKKSNEEKKKLISEDSRYKALFEPDIESSQKKIAEIENILKEIKPWTKSKLEKSEFDYSEALNF